MPLTVKIKHDNLGKNEGVYTISEFICYAIEKSSQLVSKNQHIDSKPCGRGKFF